MFKHDERPHIYVSVTEDEIKRCLIHRWREPADTYVLDFRPEHIDIPEDAKITGMQYDVARDGWIIRLTHDRFCDLSGAERDQTGYCQAEQVVLLRDDISERVRLSSTKKDRAA